MDAAAYLSSALVEAATEEALAGIQFGLGAFNQTLSCCMIHQADPGPGETPEKWRRSASPSTPAPPPHADSVNAQPPPPRRSQAL